MTKRIAKQKFIKCLKKGSTIVLAAMMLSVLSNDGIFTNSIVFADSFDNGENSASTATTYTEPISANATSNNASTASTNSPHLIGMANPVVGYNSLSLAERITGISALTMPIDPYYQLTRVSVISNEIVELTYANVNYPEIKVCIRTAKNVKGQTSSDTLNTISKLENEVAQARANNAIVASNSQDSQTAVYAPDGSSDLSAKIKAIQDNEMNISGIYGANWYTENIGDMLINLTNMDNNVSAAFWNDAQYSYSVQASPVTPKQFFNIVVPIYMSINPEP